MAEVLRPDESGVQQCPSYVMCKETEGHTPIADPSAGSSSIVLPCCSRSGSAETALSDRTDGTPSKTRSARSWAKVRRSLGNGNNSALVQHLSRSESEIPTPETPVQHSYLDNVLRSEFEFAQGRLDEDEDGDEEMVQRINTEGEVVRERRAKSIWHKAAHHRLFGGFFMALTVYALFVPDLDLIYGDTSSKKSLQIVTTFSVVLFLFEVIVQSLGKEAYLFGAYFWLDLISMISLLPDTYFFQALTDQQNLAAGRSTRLTRMVRVASRSSKAARLNRLSRIVRVAALMPRIQRFFGNSVKDDAAERLLDKKLGRLFQFLDEDMDGAVSRRAAITCLVKLRAMAGSASPGTWASKVTSHASGMAARVMDNGVNTITDKLNVVVNHVNARGSGATADKDAEATQKSPEGGNDPTYRVRARTQKLDTMMDATMTYTQFRNFLLEDETINLGLKRCCKQAIRQGNNMQNITARNSEYIGVKVALCVLLLLFTLTFVESVDEDLSAMWGLKSLNGIVQRQYPNATTGDPISHILTNQVAIWSQEGYDWGISRKFLYLDLNKITYCNELVLGLKSCALRPSNATWGAKRISLVDVDKQIQGMKLRLQDVGVLRYPDPYDLSGEDLTLEEMEVRITALAIIDKRVANEDEGTKSVLTTCVVIVVILSGISMLTKDLTFISKNLLKPLVELADEMESITRLQLAGVSGPIEDNVAQGTSEVRLMRRTFENLKKAIKSWGKYVPWPVVQLLLRAEEEAALDVTEREVSIFFSDIASFTTIVESLPPEQSLLLLSRYFHDMSKVIDEYGGIVLEFIGDAIMSIYGAPLKNNEHPTAAVKSATRMLACLKMMNEWFVEHNLPEVNIRCGVHTGQVLVGNMGFQSRMKYGVVGEESNIPGRLEELNKNYSTEMLISSATFQRLQTEQFFTRPIDIIQLHPGSAPEFVYQVMERNIKDPHIAARRMALNLHAQAMQFYRARDFTQAASKFKEVSESMQEVLGKSDVPSNLMLKRCRIYADDPPPATWDGVWDRGDIKI